MNHPILSLSPRGQITIPQKIRKELKAHHFMCVREGENIVLKPLQTRDEFLEELNEAEDGWKKSGGLTLKQMEKKYNL